MKILPPKRKKKISVRDQKKESILRELSSVLEEAGYRVRREKLGRGHGWKVLSGSCTCLEKDMIFVDRRLSQNDQISFLIAKISMLGVKVDPSRVESLPESLLKRVA